MAVVITPPAIRFAFEQTMAGVSIVNVFWTKVDPSVDVPVALDALAENVYGDFSAYLSPLQCNVLSLVSCKALYYGPVGEYSGEYVHTTAGTKSTTALPNDVAAVASWHIARTYRGGHPRTYLAGLPVSDLTSSIEFSAGALADYLGAFQDFRTGMNAQSSDDFDTVTLGTMSRSAGGVPRVDTLFEPYTSVAIQPRVCSQRRRLGPLL